MKDFSISKAGAISNWNGNAIDCALSRHFAQLTGLFCGDTIEATFPDFACGEGCLRLQQLH